MTNSTITESNTFIIVKYGDNKDALLNLSCLSQTLLYWIRKKCRVPDTEHIDLLDMEGDVRNLSSKETLLEYAYEILVPRETYILIAVNKSENHPTQYTSLLNNMAALYPQLQGYSHYANKLRDRERHRYSPTLMSHTENLHLRTVATPDEIVAFTRDKLDGLSRPQTRNSKGRKPKQTKSRSSLDVNKTKRPTSSDRRSRKS